MIIISFVVLLVIIGLIMYVIAKDPKIQEVGRIMFFCGLFAIAIASSEHFVALFKGN